MRRIEGYLVNPSYDYEVVLEFTISQDRFFYWFHEDTEEIFKNYVPSDSLKLEEGLDFIKELMTQYGLVLEIREPITHRTVIADIEDLERFINLSLA